MGSFLKLSPGGEIHIFLLDDGAMAIFGFDISELSN